MLLLLLLLFLFNVRLLRFFGIDDILAFVDVLLLLVDGSDFKFTYDGIDGGGNGLLLLLF